MKDWFETLEPRERVSVVTAGVFVAVAVLYFVIWMPLTGSQTGLATSVTTWERALAEIRPLKAAVRTAGNRARPAATGQSLVVIVDSTLGQHNLSNALQRSQPTGQNGIRVEFQDAAFDDLVRWLGDLASRHGMQVQSGNFSVSTQNMPGRVNASLTIER